jgi:hypothetical protein
VGSAAANQGAELLYLRPFSQYCWSLAAIVGPSRDRERTLDSILLLVASLFVAALLTWRLLIGSAHRGHRERNASTSSSPIRETAQRQVPSAAYKAVTVRICTSPCKAALKIRGQPFLQREAPHLPLADCDRACHCKYAEHDDRRIKRDRRSPAKNYVKASKKVATDDAREGSDRRERKTKAHGV